MIILLDLNYTLVSNSNDKYQPFSTQIEHERYRDDLLKEIQDKYVVLVTARPMKYADETLSSIAAKVNWQPDEWFFNCGLTPPLFKEKILHDHIFSEHGHDVEIVAIESNPKTREMYRSYGVKAMTYLNFMAHVKAKQAVTGPSGGGTLDRGFD